VNAVTDLLYGWKQIAHFLRVSDRTAQKWAREMGMPIHRSPGMKKSPVSVSSGELYHWYSAIASKRDRVRQPCRIRKAITVRMPEDDYESIKVFCRSHADVRTVQNFVVHAVAEYLKTFGFRLSPHI
jgi:hypothetical protein